MRDDIPVITDAVFDAAWAYDLAFAWDIAPEVDVLSRIAGVGAGDRVLLPACGTGRFALAFAERGLFVEASDINAEMIAFAARYRSHAGVRYERGDMTLPLGSDAPDCDAAFTVCNSLRYVLEDVAIDGHFRAVGRRLRAGALYFAELALSDGDPALDGNTQRWTLEQRERRVFACWTRLGIEGPRALELAEIRVEDAGVPVFEVRSRQPQRLWTSASLSARAAKNGLELRGVYLLDGTPAPDPNLPGRYYVALARRDEEV